MAQVECDERTVLVRVLGAMHVGGIEEVVAAQKAREAVDALGEVLVRELSRGCAGDEARGRGVRALDGVDAAVDVREHRERLRRDGGVARVHDMHLERERDAVDLDGRREEALELAGEDDELDLGLTVENEHELRAERAEQLRRAVDIREDAPREQRERLVTGLVAVEGVDAVETRDLEGEDVGGTVLVLAACDVRDEGAHVVDAGGGVGALDDARVDDGAHEERGLTLLAVEADARAGHHDIAALRVLGAVAHAVVMLAAGEDVVDVLLPGGTVVGVDMLGPDGAHVERAVAREVEVVDGIARPMRAVGVDIADEEVAARGGQGHGLEDAVLDAHEVGEAAKILALPVELDMRAVGELVVVHAAVGLGHELLAVVSEGGVGMGAAVAKAQGDARAVHVELGERFAAGLEALLELLGRGLAREHHELVSADAVDTLIGLGVQAQALGARHEIAVALDVAEVVVAVLEAVEVDEGERVRLAALPQHPHVPLVGGTVRKAREHVDVGGALERFVLAAESVHGVAQVHGLLGDIAEARIDLLDVDGAGFPAPRHRREITVDDVQILLGTGKGRVGHGASVREAREKVS